MTRYLAPLGIFISLILLLVYGLQTDPRRIPSPLIDKPVPGFSLPRLRDETAMINSTELGGKVSLLNIWASWCVSCRYEHPLLVDLARRQEVVIYGLNYKDERPAALRWLNDLGDPYLLSAFDQAGSVGIDFGVYGVPETYIVDAEGIIRYKHIGPLTQKDLDDTVMPLVKQLQQIP
ncbi:MAG: DsbE family thiol:disulfide interchange protein [Gammaproteobacteria bacterium]